MNTIYCHERMIRFNVTKLDQTGRQLLAVTGLLGEFCETDEATETFTEELGDFMWYVHLMCIETDMPFSSVIDAAVHNVAVDQLTAYRGLCKIAETFKKVSVTKQKKLTLDLKVETADRMAEALSYLFTRLPTGSWEEAIATIEQNITKLSARQNRDYRGVSLV